MMRLLPAILLALVAAATCAAPASGQALNCRWRTIDAGGRASTSGTTAVQGTIGQPDAGAPFGGASYAIVGGFWRGARSLHSLLIFADGFASGNTSAWSSSTPMLAATEMPAELRVAEAAAPGELRVAERPRPDPPAAPPGG